MPDARTEILHRITTALAGRPPAGPVPQDYQRTRPYPDLVSLAAERIADYRATVHRVGADGLVDRIRESLAGFAPGPMIAPPGLPDAWRVPELDWLIDQPSQPLTVPELDRAAGVLTGCALVIAETGTIVLNSGPDQGRRVLTLVPDYHLCVVRAESIVGIVPEAIERLIPDAPITFISGPSATSDIEFNRVEGVHGPRTLEVIIYGS